MASARGNTYDITTRAQAVALKEVGFTNARVSEITGIGIRQIQKYYAAARERGYNPIESKVLKDEYFTDQPRSGRPTKATPEAAAELAEQIRKTRHSRTLTLIALARNSTFNVRYMSVWRMLKSMGFSKVKPTRKPGLTAAQKMLVCAFV